MRGWDVLVIIAYGADDCARPEELRCQDIPILAQVVVPPLSRSRVASTSPSIENAIVSPQRAAVLHFVRTQPQRRA